MEIKGNIITISEDFLRIQTIKKKQEIDIFFSVAKRKAVEYRFEPHMITTIEVEPQSIEINGNKFAKIWLKHVIFPNLIKEEDYNCENGVARRNEMKKLYKKENL